MLQAQTFTRFISEAIPLIGEKSKNQCRKKNFTSHLSPSLIIQGGYLGMAVQMETMMVGVRYPEAAKQNLTLLSILTHHPGNCGHCSLGI